MKLYKIGLNFLFFTFITLYSRSSFSQVLHSENFNVILDTTKKIKGSFTPSFRYRNVKVRLIEIKSSSDITLRLKENRITFANNFEYTIFGKDKIASEGFAYVEYKKLTGNQKLLIEPFVFAQWQQLRGLKFKYSVGSNLRWRIIYSEEMGLFSGVGVLFENELWNYDGTSNLALIPNNAEDIKISKIRGSSYLSFKNKVGESIILDLSIYYLPSIENPFTDYRLASSSEIIYKFNKNVGLSILYQNIYDNKPVVPIDKLFNDITLGLAFTF